MRNISNEQFNEKYYLYKDMIYSIAYTYMKNVTDSDDIVQEVFLKYLNTNEHFKTLDNEKYWLIRVTINTCKTFLTKAWKQKVELDDSKIDVTQAKDENLFLFDIVYSLPHKYKEVIVLKYYEDLSIKDISKSLKISDSAVKKRLERARNIIKEKYNKIKGENNGWFK